MTDDDRGELMDLDPLDPLWSWNPLVHQAEGVLATKFTVPVGEAALILRIRAQARGMTVDAMADEVLQSLVGAADDPTADGPC